MKEITLEELRYFKGIANGCLREITDVDTHNAFKKILDINIIEGHGFYILNTNSKNNISKCFNSMGVNEILTKAQSRLVSVRIRSINNFRNLYNFIEFFKKIIDGIKPSGNLEKQAYKSILLYIYEVLKYEYILLTTTKVEDKNISVCITPEDMRKELLHDIDSAKRYGFMRLILMEKCHSKHGILLLSNPTVRQLLVETLRKIKQGLETHLESIDDSSTVAENRDDTNARMQQSVVAFLKKIKEEQKHQADSVVKKFLHYIQKLVSLEYKNSNGIPKKRSYKAYPKFALFPEGSPKIEDIKQGQLGDCYLLSALMSIIKKDKKLIKKCFLNSEYNERTQTVKIKLYRVKLLVKTDAVSGNVFKVSPINPIIIELDNTVFIKKRKVRNQLKDRPFGNQTTALWVNFMEKAFSVYKNMKNAVIAENALAKQTIAAWAKKADHSLSGQNVSDGLVFIPLSAITGKKSSNKSLLYIQNMPIEKLHKGARAGSIIPKFDYGDTENKIFEYIYYNLKENKPLTAGTYSESERAFNEMTSRLGIYQSHAYLIDDTEIQESARKKYIILKNPHMIEELEDPSAVTSPKPKMRKGDVKLELKIFVHYFKSVNKIHISKNNT